MLFMWDSNREVFFNTFKKVEDNLHEDTYKNPNATVEVSRSSEAVLHWSPSNPTLTSKIQRTPVFFINKLPQRKRGWNDRY